MPEPPLSGGGVERTGGKLIHTGSIFTVREDRFEHPDGTSTVRERVIHPGAVAIVPHDREVLYMVRQPREAVEELALLELPAGKLDVEGESPLEAAQRELAEEIGKRAGDWRELKRFYTSPGFASEQVILFEATGLRDARGEQDSGERIEVVEIRLADLDQTIERCFDAKSLVGLTMLRERIREPT
jgi:8-oxo-dGTP pyrophosphatase MutT (NUDIX family)